MTQTGLYSEQQRCIKSDQHDGQKGLIKKWIQNSDEKEDNQMDE